LDGSLLASLPPFALLERGQIRKILDHAASNRADAGVTVFEEATKADRFYLLLDGTVRVSKTTPQGDQVTLLHIPAGQLFGIAPALGRDTYPATAVTVSEALFLSWPVALWHSFVADYPGFGSESYKMVGARVAERNTRIVEMSTQLVEQRVARALLRLMNQAGRRTSAGIEINFPITRQDISEMTGTTLHTVSRLLSAWGKDGLVSSERKKIVICDPHRLVLLSDG